MKTTHTELPPILDATTVAELLQRRASLKLIDVRTPAEYEAEHIPGSYNLPLDKLPQYRHALREALRSPAVLVCRSGARSRQADTILRNADLDDVHILDGGMIAWEKAGNPVERGRQVWGMERQVRGVAGSLVLVGVLGGLAWKPLTYLAAGVGAGLTFSAVSNTCTMANLLGKLPYNKGASCDVQEVVSRLGAEETTVSRPT
ncbi:MAG: rhodanese-like domain-containing protein [Chloroflexia bacterium]